MTDLRRIRAREERVVSASAADLPGLAVAFLSELVKLRDEEDFLGRTIRVRALGNPPTALVATVQGERFDPGRHLRHFDVKGITFHDLKVDPAVGRARVIVDI
jgi:SHS2 domain-containing protein